LSTFRILPIKKLCCHEREESDLILLF